MKRFLGILLSITLLLTLFGCGKTPVAEPDTTTSSAPTEITPTTEPTSAPNAEPAVFSLRTLPDIGAFVSDEKKAYFFDDGAHDTFEPRKDYGRIVPYCATVEEYYPTDWTYTDEETGEVYTGSSDDESPAFYVTYGFATEDGRIITGDIYADVYRYEDSRGDVVYAAYPETSYEMYGKVDLITSDGSRLVRFDDEDTELSIQGGFDGDRNIGYVMVGSGDQATLYDYSCNELADLTPYLTNEYMRIPYLEYVDEKSMLIRIDDDAGNSRYYRYGFDGKVLTAFPEELSYMRGVYGNELLIMSENGDWELLVSMNGKRLTDTFLEMRWSNYYNCFFGVTDGEMVCFDADGKRIEGRSDEDFGRLEKDYSVNYLYDPETHALLDRDFRPIPLEIDEGEIVWLQDYYGYRNTIDRTILMIRASNDDVYLFDNTGKRLAKFSDVIYNTYDYDEDGENDEIADGVEERYYQLECDNGVICAQKEGRLEVVDEAMNRSYDIPWDRAEYYRSEYTLTDDAFYISYQYDDGTYQWYQALYRRSDGARLFTDLVYVANYGDRIVAATSTHSYLLDATGKILLCLKNDKLV